MRPIPHKMQLRPAIGSDFDKDRDRAYFIHRTDGVIEGPYSFPPKDREQFRRFYREGMILVESDEFDPDFS